LGEKVSTFSAEKAASLYQGGKEIPRILGKGGLSKRRTLGGAHPWARRQKALRRANEYRHSKKKGWASRGQKKK